MAAMQLSRFSSLLYSISHNRTVKFSSFNGTAAPNGTGVGLRGANTSRVPDIRLPGLSLTPSADGSTLITSYLSSTFSLSPPSTDFEGASSTAVTPSPTSVLTNVSALNPWGTPPPGINLSETGLWPIRTAYFVLVVAVAICFLLRAQARRASEAGLGWDDWLMIPATLLSLVSFCITMLWMVPHGLGKHVWATPADSLYVLGRGLLINEAIYILIQSCLKASITLFMWRLFGRQGMKRPIYALGIIISCWSIGAFLITIFQCTPVNHFWMRYYPEMIHMTDRTPPMCRISMKIYFLIISVPNTLINIIIVVMPMRCLNCLQLPRWQKYAVLWIFLLWIIVVMISGARMWSIAAMDDNSIDITYNLVRTLVWSCVEFNLGIVCICVALFRPLLYVFLWGTVHPEPDAILFPWAKPGRLRQNPRGHMATYQRVNDAKMAVASVAIVGRPVKARTVQDAKGIRRTTDIDVTIQEGEDDVNWMGKWNASWKDLGADARL